MAITTLQQTPHNLMKGVTYTSFFPLKTWAKSFTCGMLPPLLAFISIQIQRVCSIIAVKYSIECAVFGNLSLSLHVSIPGMDKLRSAGHIWPYGFLDPARQTYYCVYYSLLLLSSLSTSAFRGYQGKFLLAVK